MKTKDVAADQPMVVRTKRGEGKTAIANRFLKHVQASTKSVIFIEDDADLEFFQAFRVRMDALGITQQELAKRLKITQQQVSKTLSGVQSPNLETIARFAEAMNLVVVCSFCESSGRE